MAFACQRNSYLREMLVKVVSCTKAKEGFEVILDDTPLFPEGGGQPCDEGLIGEVNVFRVLRRGMQAVHLTNEPVNEGEEINCKINWSKRFDHMQQHSAQHLLSAIADNKYNFRTVSWDLGKSISHVELNTPKITEEQLTHLELICNEAIRNHKPLTVHYLTKQEALGLREVKSRGLPEDVIEPIRVIEIEGIEKNMCCGTHVSNLAHVQAIKLMHTEAMRGGTRLFFLAGERCFGYMGSSLEIERKLTKILSCGRSEYADSIDKLKSSLRSIEKSFRNNLKELAKFEADNLTKSASELGYIFKHREEGDTDYIFAVLNSLADSTKDLPVFICTGATKSGGQFVLRAPDEKLTTLAEEICLLVNGKGGAKKGQFQGKALNYKKLKDVHDILIREAKKF
ncbi:alanyl-tRNA editing protein Aarsd1-A-like isoform X1 [Hydra vulgaris]|uniref:Alanyl-tRNA editing protein Aarsd1-A-like isoform X1 n=1 Tax=Hydra vulgaris TaxID=6087 RepID=A0ABM4CXN3_HYDVU